MTGVQVGQFIGARGDFVPEEICRKLTLLHDQVTFPLQLSVALHTSPLLCFLSPRCRGCKL